MLIHDNCCQNSKCTNDGVQYNVDCASAGAPVSAASDANGGGWFTTGGGKAAGDTFPTPCDGGGGGIADIDTSLQNNDCQRAICKDNTDIITAF